MLEPDATPFFSSDISARFWPGLLHHQATTVGCVICCAWSHVTEGT